MATADLISGSMATESRAEPGANRPRLDRQVLAWCLLSTLLLIGMGIFRTVQARRYEASQSVDTTSPFPLKNIPTEIDGWRAVEGSDTQLDPLTTRTTGSTDHIIRSYFDETTGVTLAVLVLYGPAEPVMPHVPQVCYPASGFRSVGATIDHHLKINDTQDAVVRSSVFSKSGGRSVNTENVYHTYRVDGEWIPILAGKRLSIRNTGVFKIQIHRRVFDGERLGTDEPIESFYKKIIPVVETMTTEAIQRRGAPTSSSPTPPNRTAPAAPAISTPVDKR